MTNKQKKLTAEKKLIFFGSKTTIYLSLGIHKGRPSYKRSHQLSKENINMQFLNFFYFCGSCFALLDPDPDSEYGYGSGSTDLTESGSKPDPEHCF